MRASATGQVARRFQSAEIDPTRSIGLRADHPAAVTGATIFPSTVTSAWQSPRLLVSGANNPKLGKAVIKGPRAGWPIYHVTLEERATCPRSCHAWLTCYGNAIPYARRHDADADLIPLLNAEVLTVARQHPDGLLVRLHTLGDFYSVDYVMAWWALLRKLPQLHVFGYTARSETEDDAESRAVAAVLRIMADTMWDRFAIRFSRSDPGPGRSIVVDADPNAPDVIVCPAQTKATEACASCGLCWAEAARAKTIAFLRHGMKRRPGAAARPIDPPTAPVAAKPIPEPAPIAANENTMLPGTVDGALAGAAQMRGMTIFAARTTVPGAGLVRLLGAHALRLARPDLKPAEIAKAFSLNPVQMAPSQRRGVTEAEVQALARRLRPLTKVAPLPVAAAPPRAPPPAPAVIAPRPTPVKRRPTRFAAPPERPIRKLVDVESRRAAAMAAEASRLPSYHRTDADRRAPSKVVTGQLLGDPPPGAPRPSEMTSAEIIAHNNRILPASVRRLMARDE